jgi:hypothetical protein
MDYTQLLAPYSDNERSLGGQIKWLVKKGIPQSSIDYAISSVYSALANGKTFSDGNELDQELLAVAKEHETKDIEDQLKKRIGEISNNLDAEWNGMSTVKKLWEVLWGRA